MARFGSRAGRDGLAKIARLSVAVVKVFRVFSEWFRERTDEWLIVHKHGEYQYRNPDSAFIHQFGTFKSEADAREYLEQQIAPVERHKWRLYRLVPDE